MSSETTLVAEQCRLREWAAQIKDCQSRPAGMSVVSWCACHGITKANYYYRLRRVREACLESLPQEMSDRQIIPVEPALLQQRTGVCCAPDQGLDISIKGCSIHVTEDTSMQLLSKVLGGDAECSMMLLALRQSTSSQVIQIIREELLSKKFCVKANVYWLSDNSSRITIVHISLLYNNNKEVFLIMQERNYSFEGLEAELLDRLKTRGYTSITITGYRYQCNSIFAWLKEKGYSSYRKKAGIDFLQDYKSKHGDNQYYKSLRTVIYRLNDIIDATWRDVHSDKGKHFCIADDFIEVVDKYCCWANNTGHASGTIKCKRYAVSWFLDELSKLQCFSLEQLSPMLITSACVKITDHNLWGEVRVFLRYLAEFEIVKSDYSTIVPHYSKPYVIPSVYSVEEIKQIEESVDTNTVLGKRDYAMILLASRMGMRSGDIVKLRIEDVKDRAELNIIQEKTGNTLHLPLVKEVQLAIEDYLSVRPSSPIEQIFINVYAPYHAVTTSTLRRALKKYITLSRVDPGNRKCGPHALRSSLASSMVNDDISYETVRKVLGHSSNNAIKHYARIDVEKLRRYSLTPPVPTGRFYAFLYGEVK